MQETQETQPKTSTTRPQTFILSDMGFSITEDTLHYFGIEGARLIAEVEAPEIFHEMKSLEDLQSFSDLINSKTDIPSRFFETLNMIHMLQGPNTIRFLDEEKIFRREDECEGQFLCRVFREDRALFARLTKRVEDKITSNGVSFSVSRVTKPVLREKDFFKDKLEEIELACRLYNQLEGYTDHCIVHIVNINGREGFRVERGSHLSLLPVLEKKERLTRNTVIRKMDTVFFDPDTQTVWVNAKGQKSRDISSYKMIATRILTGHAEAHENLNINLKCIKDKNLKRKLDKPRDFAERIVLRQVHFSRQIDSCVTSPLKASSDRMGCLTDQPDFPHLAGKISSFSGAEIKVVVNEENAVFDKITIGSGKIVYGGVVGLNDIFNLLSDLDMIDKFYDA